MNRPLLYVTIVTETKSLCAMNKNLRARTSFNIRITLIYWEPDATGSVPPAEEKTPAGEPHDFPICCHGLQAPLQSCFHDHSAERSPLQRPDTPPGKANGRKCLAEYLSKLPYQ